MSNYTILICDKNTEQSARTFFRGDCSVLDMKHHCFIVHPAQKINSTAGFFLGHSINHSKKHIVYCNSDYNYWPDTNHPTEGCYIRVNINTQADKQLIGISGDIFRQLPMFYFCTSGFFGISDSLFMLTELRKSLNLPCKLNEEATLARLWINGIADQLLSTDTIIQDVWFCPLGSALDISLQKQKIALTHKKMRLNDAFGADSRPYEEEIRKGAERIASIIASIVNIKGADVSLSLSGGLDSRVALAAIQYSDLISTVRVTSIPNHKDDFRIASKLSESMGFKLNQPLTERSVKGYLASPLQYWGIFSAGIYDPLYCIRRRHTTNARFSIGGQGAEVYKGNYGWRKLKNIAKYVPPESREAFLVQAEQGLQSIGIAKEDPWGSEWSYLAYRNALHSGRFIMSNLLAVRPILQAGLVNVSRSEKNPFPAPKKDDVSMVVDLLIALSPQLAMMPFDRPEKSLTRAFIEERQARIGTLKPVVPYEVHGNPAAVPAGPSRIAVELAQKRGFHGGFDGDSAVERLMERGYGISSKLLRPALDKLMPEALDHLNRSHGSHRSARAAGKIMMLSLAESSD